MPMRWTPENDHMLLVKILETHELSVDTKKVQEAWPKQDGQGQPTARAISERLVKIRNLAKDRGVSPKKGDKSPASARKRKSPNGGTPASKRARTKKGDETPKDGDPEIFKPTKEEEKENCEVIADYPPEDVFFEDAGPPSLRIGSEVFYKEDSDNDGLRKYETTDSEYVA